MKRSDFLECFETLEVIDVGQYDCASLVTFEIDDGTAAGAARIMFHVQIRIVNVNDPPQIQDTNPPGTYDVVEDTGRVQLSGRDTVVIHRCTPPRHTHTCIYTGTSLSIYIYIYLYVFDTVGEQPPQFPESFQCRSSPPSSRRWYQLFLAGFALKCPSVCAHFGGDAHALLPPGAVADHDRFSAPAILRFRRAGD